ncbi:MAG: DUF429 domain-containing protein [Pseudobdellovibrionaceae bacterium]
MQTRRLSSASRASRKLELKFTRFVGVSLGGGKSDKACVAVLEYYPEHQKVFLSRLFEKIKTEGEISADLKIHEVLEAHQEGLHAVAFDVPLQMPKCIRCPLPCPGYERCTEPEIKWMWKWTHSRNSKKRPKKLFTPYTQSCSEMYVQTELEEPFILSDTLGSNIAPLVARAHFIKRRFGHRAISIHPKLSIWRIGRSLKVAKSHLRHHRHSVGGDESRHIILEALSKNNVAFMYHQDLKAMVENSHAFEAFICALTVFLRYRGQTEKRPLDFPKEEEWLEFPISHIKW